MAAFLFGGIVVFVATFGYLAFTKFPFAPWLLFSTLPFQPFDVYNSRDFLDTEEQQQIIFDKARLIKPHLPPERTDLLDRWITAEKNYGDY